MSDTKRKLVSNVRAGDMSGEGGISQLRELAKNHPEQFTGRVQCLVDDGKLRLGSFRDLKSLFMAFRDIPVKATMEEANGGMRAVTTAAFPLLIGTTVVAALNEAYDAVPTVSDQLVMDFTDAKKETTIARIINLDKEIERVPEGKPFPEVSASEDYCTIGEWRNGRMLKITAETVEQNDLANIVEKVDFLGSMAAKTIEKHTLKRVIDLTGSGSSAAAPYVYRPNGTGTTLFSASANTPGTRAPSGTRINDNALADESDLDAALTRLATVRDDNGDPILINPSELVVLAPFALQGVLLKIKGSETIPSTGSSLTVNNWGPRGKYANWQPVVSQYLDLWSSTAWYMGSPKKQYRRKWALQLEYVTLGESTQAYLDSRIAFQARIAWNCEVGAIDYVHFIQCLSSTSIPS